MRRSLLSPVLWFTGLSGVGKSTVASGLRNILERDGVEATIVDGDTFREKKSYKNDFSRTAIIGNNQLIVEECGRQRAPGKVVLVAVISPFEQSRLDARKALSPGYREIYLMAPLSCLRQRDTKGLYAREERGEIKNLIGVSSSSPYEQPRNPDAFFDTQKIQPEEIVENLRFRLRKDWFSI